MTRVVNLKKEKYDIYIGRANRTYNLKQSIWFNPFRIGIDGTRQEVIKKYREYILNNKALLKLLPELKGKVLGCWCKPLECHGDVLVELIEND